MSEYERLMEYGQLLRFGHLYTALTEPGRAKPGSHDDGPASGMFLGGIGASVCSRDLNGSFSRWHMQSGLHVRQEISSGFVSLRWASSSDSGCMRLNEQGAQENGFTREVRSLFPVVQERYIGISHDFDIVLEWYSAIYPEAYRESSLPLFYLTIGIENRGEERIDFDSAYFFPNLLGWKQQQMTSADRSAVCWPSQTHAGNTSKAYTSDGISGVIMRRHPERTVDDEMEGQIGLFVLGTFPRSGREVCFKAGQNLVEREPAKQGHTIAWVEDRFKRDGKLPGSQETWEAHWDEALGSAVAAGGTLEPRSSTAFHFTCIFDMPIARFGEGRRWYRKYTEYFDGTGKHTERIAQYAMEHRSRIREQISSWHEDFLGTGSERTKRQRAFMMNELYLINGGGTVWLKRQYDREAPELEVPGLGDHEHAGLLEGFDIGYYYYNTSDIWPYSWYAVSRWWPEFSDLVFEDYLKTITLDGGREHMIYRTEELVPNSIFGKIPHDHGAPPEDPFHKINGYQMRDDSNLWKDHNPGFLISYHLHLKILGRAMTSAEWQVLKAAGEYMIADTEADGLPCHQAFGDSTWDNLGIRGRASFSGSLTIAAYHVLSEMADSQGDDSFSQTCRSLADTAERSFMEHLYTGHFFRLCDTGKYRSCVNADGMLGFYLMDLAGLKTERLMITEDMIAEHLKSVYQFAFLDYEQGSCGPLLVAAEGQTHFSGDGGDELQVNEVLIGSAWLMTAMLDHYGLKDHAVCMSEAVMRTLYERGLQFRTPAAVDAAGRFRAPMNLRPLSVWFLDMNRRFL